MFIFFTSLLVSLSSPFNMVSMEEYTHIHIYILYVSINSSWHIISTVFHFISVQSFSPVQLFAAPWTAVHQASLSITYSWRFLKLLSSQWCYSTISFSEVSFFSHLQSFLASGFFQWVSSSHQVAKVLEFHLQLPVNIQNWSPLGWTGWISLPFKGLSRVFSNTTVRKHQSLALTFLYSPTLLEKP